MDSRERTARIPGVWPYALVLVLQAILALAYLWADSPFLDYMSGALAGVPVLAALTAAPLLVYSVLLMKTPAAWRTSLLRVAIFVGLVGAPVAVTGLVALRRDPQWLPLIVCIGLVPFVTLAIYVFTAAKRPALHVLGLALLAAVSGAVATNAIGVAAYWNG